MAKNNINSLNIPQMEKELKTRMIDTVRMQFGTSISLDFLQKHGLKVGIQAVQDNFIFLLTTKLFTQEKQSDVHEEPKKISYEYLSPGIWNNIKNHLNNLTRKRFKFLSPKMSYFEMEYIEKTITTNYCGYSFPTEK